ncbi:hypothetical protein, partial [Cellulosimicrobium sp. CUA-896]|uniref:hypothetical protein n=1 Tax=Cellulosimicrobium sp. CUA-896 TaxID=1517881 RepID=UPI000964FCCC
MTAATPDGTPDDTPDGTPTTPPHRSLLSRLDAALTAPDATSTERALGYGTALVGAALAVVLAVAPGDDAGLAVWQVALLALVGFDLFGGVVVNATVTGSRRFHAPGASRRGLVTFTAVHVHPLVVAALVPGLPWSTALVTYAGILGVVAVVALLVPPAVRAPSRRGRRRPGRAARHGARPRAVGGVGGAAPRAQARPVPRAPHRAA